MSLDGIIVSFIACGRAGTLTEFTARVAWSLVRRGFAQQIRIHDPAVSFTRLFAYRQYLVPDLDEFARPQDLIVGSEIGAPEDFEVLIGQRRKRLHAVEQHDH